VRVERAHLFGVVADQFLNRSLRNPGIFEQADRSMAQGVKRKFARRSLRVPADSPAFVCLFFAQTSLGQKARKLIG